MDLHFWVYRPTQKENILEKELKAIQFDIDGQFIKEFTVKTPVFVKKMSKEESQKIMNKMAEKYGRPNINGELKK